MPSRSASKSGVGLAAAGLGCGLFGSDGAFRARFEGRVIDFNCEVQSLHKDAIPSIRPIPPGAGPSNRMMGLDPGKETVAWLYHFEDDGSVMKDEEFAYSIAVVLKARKPGTYAMPGDGASILFFCDNWGRGFRACEATAVEGWLRVDEASGHTLRGEFDVRMAGKKERLDRTQEDVTIGLRGAFAAVP